MAIDDVLLDVLTESDDDLYEDDYMKVVKIIKEIQTGSKDYVKRLQLVIWKKKNTELPDFDIRGFHDEILKDGPVPLSLLEKKITTWIAQQ